MSLKTSPKQCAVCGRHRIDVGTALCEPCMKSLKRVEARDMTILAAIVWAARRARKFATERFADN